MESGGRGSGVEWARRSEGGELKLGFVGDIAVVELVFRPASLLAVPVQEESDQRSAQLVQKFLLKYVESQLTLSSCSESTPAAAESGRRSLRGRHGRQSAPLPDNQEVRQTHRGTADPQGYGRPTGALPVRTTDWDKLDRSSCASPDLVVLEPGRVLDVVQLDVRHCSRSVMRTGREF